MRASKASKRRGHVASLDVGIGAGAKPVVSRQPSHAKLAPSVVSPAECPGSSRTSSATSQAARRRSRRPKASHCLSCGELSLSCRRESGVSLPATIMIMEESAKNWPGTDGLLAHPKWLGAGAPLEQAVPAGAASSTDLWAQPINGVATEPPSASAALVACSSRPPRKDGGEVRREGDLETEQLPGRRWAPLRDTALRWRSATGTGWVVPSKRTSQLSASWSTRVTSPRSPAVKSGKLRPPSTQTVVPTSMPSPPAPS
mmetsp:Transcript_9805/g.21936  ORF Transcript_9805/g.21936 Transcript_9805/m.21936 type:complete len:258 (+) Transcript_9805:732-1505(+)